MDVYAKRQDLRFSRIFKIIFLKKMVYKNKRKGIGVKLFSNINSIIISQRKKDPENKY
jgi:hypothetical protein